MFLAKKELLQKKVKKFIVQIIKIFAIKLKKKKNGK